MNSHRLFVLAVLAAVGSVILADAAEARHWRRGWPGYYVWGYPAWAFPPGGYSGPSQVWYVPPAESERAIVLPKQRCAAGRAPARWVRERKDGREIWRHVMSRCR